MIPEGFIPIPGYTKYFINKKGDVYSKFSKRILIPKANKKRWGYNYISLQEPGVKVKNWLVQRLVMFTFTGIKEGLEINHIDGNKSNNSLENLEWVTSSENKFHKYRVLGIKHTDKQRETSRINGESTGKKVLMYDKQGNFIREFSSTKKAGLFVNRTGAAIGYCCNGVTRYTAGYIFKYE